MQDTQCEEISESAQSATGEFGQKNASKWISLKGGNQNKPEKNVHSTKQILQESGSPTSPYLCCCPAFTKYSRFLNNADKGSNNS